MIRMQYALVPADKRAYMERQHALNIANGFDEVVDTTWQWLQTPEAQEFFFEQRGQLNRFFRESGIHERWDEIIETRARTGADMTQQIYEYARKLNMDTDVLHYTAQERTVMNKLCDNTYELIRNVTTDQVKGIRQSLIRDYAEGNNPRQTHLREVQLEPINGWTPEQRAVVIARTESATALNSGMLQQYASDGIQFVTLLCNSDCDECLAYAEENGQEKMVPISEALDTPCIHPNCRCVWVPCEGQMIT